MLRNVVKRGVQAARNGPSPPPTPAGGPGGPGGNSHGGSPWFQTGVEPGPRRGGRELLRPWGDERVRSLSHRGARCQCPLCLPRHHGDVIQSGSMGIARSPFPELYWDSLTTGHWQLATIFSPLATRRVKALTHRALSFRFGGAGLLLTPQCQRHHPHYPNIDVTDKIERPFILIAES